MNKTIRTTLFGLLVLPLAAQSQGFGVSGAALLPLESLKKATHGSLAFSLGVDYLGKLDRLDMGTRVGLGLASMPGQTRNGLKTDLTLVQAFGDLRIDTPKPALRGILGLSLNSYSMKKTGTESQDPGDVDHHFPVRDAKGLKLGIRLGFTYDLTERLSGELLLQQTELAGKDLEDPLVRRAGINPAWIQVGLRWAF